MSFVKTSSRQTFIRHSLFMHTKHTYYSHSNSFELPKFCHSHTHNLLISHSRTFSHTIIHTIRHASFVLHAMSRPFHIHSSMRSHSHKTHWSATRSSRRACRVIWLDMRSCLHYYSQPRWLQAESAACFERTHTQTQPLLHFLFV